MGKFLLSIVFLALLYFVKIIIDFNKFNNDPDCHNPHEKVQDSMSMHAIAILLSYIFCLVGAYEEWIQKQSCADFLIGIITISGLVLPPYLISLQNKRNNGVANSFSDMSGAVFFISTVTKPTTYFLLYASAFILFLLLFIVKCEGEDNDILQKVIGIGVDAILLIPTIFCDKLVSFLLDLRFMDNMLYYAILMFLSEVFIPPISSYLISILYDNFKRME